MGAAAFAFQAFDSVGAPVSGAKYYFYEKGTTTPQTAYTDSALLIPALNPAIGNSLGRLLVYLDDTLSYSIEVRTSDDATVLAQLDYTSGDSDPFSLTYSPLAAYNAYLETLNDTVIEGLDSRIPETDKGIAGGVATLDSNGRVVQQGGSIVADLTELAASSYAGTIIVSDSLRLGIFERAAGDQSANVTADPNQIEYVAYSSDATGAGGAWRRVIENNTITFAMAGAATTDTNAGPAIQAAIRYGQSKGYHVKGAGLHDDARYTTTAQIAATEGVPLVLTEFNIHSTFDPQSGSNVDRATLALCQQTAHPAREDVATAAAVGDSTLEIDDATGWAAGQDILAIDPTVTNDEDTTDNSEPNTIVSIASNVLTLASPLALPYTTNSKVFLFDPGNRVVVRGRMSGIGATGEQVGIWAGWAYRSTIDVYLDGFHYYATRFEIPFQSDIRVRAYNSFHPGRGYGLGTRGAIQCRFNVSGQNLRHAYSNGSDTAGLDDDITLRVMARNNVLDHVICWGAYGAVVDFHAGDTGSVWYGCTGRMHDDVEAGGEDFVVIQSADAQCNGPIFGYNVDQHGVHIQTNGGGDDTTEHRFKFEDIEIYSKAGGGKALNVNPDSGVSGDTIVEFGKLKGRNVNEAIGADASGANIRIDGVDVDSQSAAGSSGMKISDTSGGRVVMNIQHDLRLTNDSSSVNLPTLFAYGDDYAGADSSNGPGVLINVGGDLILFNEDDATPGNETRLQDVIITVGGSIPDPSTGTLRNRLETASAGSETTIRTVDWTYTDLADNA